MKFAINPQVFHVKESATLAINQKVKTLRAQGKKIYHFGFGQSPFPVPRVLQNALQANTDKKDYLPLQGLPELCEAVADFYSKEFGYAFSPSHVCVGPGSKELIFQLIYLLEGVLLIPSPSWVSYGHQARLGGKAILPIPTQRANGYRLQAEELDRICHQQGGSQKILIFNNPSNPTGSCHSESEIKELSEICRAYGLIVISDEIYALINFSGQGHFSMAQHYPEGTIVTGGLSKVFSAGGYRLGVALLPNSMNEVLHALKVFISETFSAVSTPIQYAALAAYGSFHEMRQELERCTAIHQFAGEYLQERFVGMGLQCPKPQGAFYLFPDFENYQEPLKAKGVFTSPQLVHRVLEEADVAVLPASDFYLPATHWGVRVASVDYDGETVLAQFPQNQRLDSQKIEDLFPNLVQGCDRLENFLASL